MKSLLIIGAVAAGMLMAAAVSAFGAGSGPAVPLAPEGVAALQQPADEELGAGARRIATKIAAQFGVSEDEVLQLHKEGAGFGAMFKVYQLAKAKGVSAPSLVASFPRVNGELEPGFGDLFAALTADQKSQIEDHPKNLGQLVSARAKKR